MKINTQQSPEFVKPQSSNNRAIATIQKQIQSLQEQLSKVNNSSTISPESKATKKKAIEQQIAALNEQLRQEEMKQEKAQKKKESQSTVQNNANSTKGKENTGFSNDEMQAMVNASTSFNNAESISQVRTHMSGQAHNLKGEIAAIESRGGNPTEQKQQLGELEENINKVTTKLVQEYDKAAKPFKQSHASKLNDEKVKEDEKEEDSVKNNGNLEETAQNNEAKVTIDLKL